MHSVSDTSDKIHEATECSEYEERQKRNIERNKKVLQEIEKVRAP